MTTPDSTTRTTSGIRSWWADLGKHRRRMIMHTLMILGVGLIYALITIPGPFVSLQWTLSDQLFLPDESSPNIVIAAIDDASLDIGFKWDTSQGKWVIDPQGSGKRLLEWPRTLHAQAIANLNQAQAGVIGFDILFSETSDQAQDAALAMAMANAGNVVQPMLGSLAQPGKGEKVFQKYEQPNPILYAASPVLGHGNVLPDHDGKVRRIPLIVRTLEGEAYPCLTLAMLNTFNPVLYPPDYVLEGGKFRLGVRDIPVDGSTTMRINYVNKPGKGFTTISYKDVILGNFDPEQVKHKIVLVGVMAEGITDHWVTPISREKMYGVEVHANAMDTILTARFVTEASTTSTFLVVLLLVGIAGVSLPWLNLRWGGLLTILLVVAYVVMAVFLFYRQGSILNLVYLPVGLVLVYVTSIILRITSEQVDKREVRDLFGKYVSPQVAGEILRSSDANSLSLGGEEREVTVLFTDIRGFTQLSEQLTPDQIVNMLNRYFSVVIDRILANDGMINKFAGDNIMAVWNAPQLQSDQAIRAVKSAMESQKAIQEIREQNPDLPQVQFGFGINTGPAIAGNVGSAGRLEYTVIGDAVNLAARLCGDAPGDEVWISQETKGQLRDTIPTTPLEPRQFKGKSEPVPVYQVEWRQALAISATASSLARDSRLSE